MAQPTTEERRVSLLHAAVWEQAFNSIQEQIEHPVDAEFRRVMMCLAVFARTIGEEYRKIANGGEIR